MDSKCGLCQRSTEYIEDFSFEIPIALTSIYCYIQVGHLNFFIRIKIKFLQNVMLLQILNYEIILKFLLTTLKLCKYRLLGLLKTKRIYV